MNAIFNSYLVLILITAKVAGLLTQRRALIRSNSTLDRAKRVHIWPLEKINNHLTCYFGGFCRFRRAA